jgi:hypothetical protein
MHLASVLEYLDSFCDGWLVAHNGPGLFEMPAVLEAVSAEVVFSGCPIKWLAAMSAERFQEQTDILQACCAVGNFTVLLEACPAAQTGQREKNILCRLQKLS